MMKEYELSKTYRLIEHGPVVLVTTAYKGQNNIMTMSFHMMLEFEPPLIGCVIGPWDHSFKALRTTKECVLAIPTVDLATKVVDIGNCSGDEVDKFKKFKLTALPGAKVKAPLIGECLANIECRVLDPGTRSKHSIIILRAVKTWIDPRRKERRTLHHYGDGTFAVDGRKINLKKRMVKWQDMLD